LKKTDFLKRKFCEKTGKRPEKKPLNPEPLKKPEKPELTNQSKHGEIDRLLFFPPQRTQTAVGKKKKL